MSTLQYQRDDAAAPPHDRDVLLGERRHAAVHSDLDIAAPLLLNPLTPMTERWLSSGPVTTQQRASVSYRTDGHWLYGTASLDDSSLGLEVAAHQIYVDIFSALGETRTPHLLRLWNYFADINGESDDLERYRQFNVGRQRAFFDAKRSPFAGAPAACALGVDVGPLTVHFLAGRTVPVAVENQRQVSAYHYPDAYGPSSPTFSRATLVAMNDGNEGLFISGTASIVGHATQRAGDVRGQTMETLVNICAVLERANAQTRANARRPYTCAGLDYTAYVRHPADLEAVRDVFEGVVGADSPAARRAIYLRGDICRSDLLMEIEAHALRQ